MVCQGQGRVKMPGTHSSSIVIPYELWERAKKQGIVINRIVRKAIEEEVERKEGGQ